MSCHELAAVQVDGSNDAAQRAKNLVLLVRGILLEHYRPEIYLAGNLSRANPLRKLLRVQTFSTLTSSANDVQVEGPAVSPRDTYLASLRAAAAQLDEIEAGPR
jgi:hypothetical protein